MLSTDPEIEISASFVAMTVSKSDCTTVRNEFFVSEMYPFLLGYLKICISCKCHLSFWPLPVVRIFQQMQL